MLHPAPGFAPNDEESLAVRSIDFKTLLSDEQRKAILTAMVQTSCSMTAREIGLKLHAESPDVQKDIPAALKRMKTIGVLQPVRRGEEPAYCLSEPMAKEIARHLAPQHYAVSEHDLPADVSRKLRTEHTSNVRAALQVLGKGTEEEVTEKLCQMTAPKTPMCGQAWTAKICSVRTVLLFLLQHGVIGGDGYSQETAMTFIHLPSRPEHHAEAGDERAPPELPSQCLQNTEQCVEERRQAEAIQAACLKVLVPGPFQCVPLRSAVRKLMGTEVKTLEITKAVQALVRRGTIDFKPRRGYALVVKEDDDDDENEGVGVLAPKVDTSQEEVAKRVQEYLLEAQRWQDAAAEEPSPEPGPRLPQVRLREYLEACACKNAAEISKLLEQKNLEPYDLFVAHQECCAVVQSVLLRRFGTRARRLLGPLPAGATQNLREKFPEETLPAAVTALRSTQRCSVALVRKFLRHSLDPQYRNRVL